MSPATCWEQHLQSRGEISCRVCFLKVQGTSRPGTTVNEPPAESVPMRSWVTAHVGPACPSGLGHDQAPPSPGSRKCPGLSPGPDCLGICSSVVRKTQQWCPRIMRRQGANFHMTSLSYFRVTGNGGPHHSQLPLHLCPCGSSARTQLVLAPEAVALSLCAAHGAASTGCLLQMH